MILHEPPASTSRWHAVSNPGGYDYLRSLPSAARASTSWPLILFLHGSAFRGDDPTVVATHGLPRLLSGVEEVSAAESAIGTELAANFAVVAPQCPDHEVWDDDALLALLDEIENELNVDARRVYLTGLSMGGFGVWSLGLRHLRRFAALVPICGGGRLTDVARAARNEPDALRRLGVWAFHGAKDLTVPLEESVRMIDAVKKAGVREARLTIYPDAEHDAWSETYANPELYAWLLRHAH